MKPHRDRVSVEAADGSGQVLGHFGDGYIAVVYLRGSGTLVLEEWDGTQTASDEPGGGGAWVPPSHALRRREVSIVPGRLVAWPNFAFTHWARPDDGQDSARWILGPVALLPGRKRLTGSGDCGGGGCSGAPVRAVPDPPTRSKRGAEELAGSFRDNIGCTNVTFEAGGTDELTASGRCLCLCPFGGEVYVRFENDGPFEANGGMADGKLNFSEDIQNLKWSYCFTPFQLTRLSTPSLPLKQEMQQPQNKKQQPEKQQMQSNSPTTD
eukprot:Hpha_TRINITY_DN6243_c0_g1::TRINITY_DN6243_c0_g1_i1::g.23573::m.23573